MRVALDRLKERISYDPKTGVFRWRVDIKGGVKAGDIAGKPASRPYGRIRIDRQLYWAHHLAWFYVYGVWATSELDHIDGNKSNNRIQNLREATRRTQCENLHRARRDNKSSGLLGVTKHGLGFKAQIKIMGRNVYIGTFGTALQAHRAYLKQKRSHHKGCTI